MDTIATESTAAKTDRSTILRLMKEHRVTSYSRGGRRFARVPGDEKLMISKTSGDSDTSAPAEPEEPLEDEQLEDVDEDETGEVDEDPDEFNESLEDA
jgi:hypothetical protein